MAGWTWPASVGARTDRPRRVPADRDGGAGGAGHLRGSPRGLRRAGRRRHRRRRPDGRRGHERPVSACPNVSVLLQTSDGTLGAPTSYSLGATSARTVSPSATRTVTAVTDIVVSYGGSRPDSFIARFLQNAGGTLDPGGRRTRPMTTHRRSSSLTWTPTAGRTCSSPHRLGPRRLPPIPFGQFRPRGAPLIPGCGPRTNRKGWPSATSTAMAAPMPCRGFQPRVDRASTRRRRLAGARGHLAQPGDILRGVPLTIRWAAGDTVALAGFDVSLGVNNGSGSVYTPIAGCTGLPPTATECVWTPTSTIRSHAVSASRPATARARPYSRRRPSTRSRRRSPRARCPRVRGRRRRPSWFHNLPTNDTVRVELTRDGGASYETLAAAAPISIHQRRRRQPSPGPSPVRPRRTARCARDRQRLSAFPVGSTS